jgi:AAA family ATP:ADP antiporter
MAIKSQAKTFIDVFVDTTATGIGGILLIFIVNGLNFSVRAVCIMILVLICIWIYFAIRVRKEYVLAFQNTLGIPRQEPKKKDFRISDADVADGIRNTLQSGSVKQILFLLARIEESKDARLIQDAIPLLSHVSPKVREAALRCLAFHTDHTVAQQIEPLLKDPNEEVRSRAFSTLLAHTRHNRVHFIDDYLNDKDPAVSGAALVGLASEARDNPVMQRLFNLEQRLLEKINQTGLLQDTETEEANKILIARTIGNGKLVTYYPLLLNYMNDENPAVVKQAIRSAGNSQDPDFVKMLLGFLAKKSTRASAQKALAKYEPAEILPILTEVRGEKGTVQKILVRLPSIAETMDTQQAIDYLFGLVQRREPAVRLEAIKTLHKMKRKFPHLTISGKRVMPILMEEIDLYKNILAMSYAARHDESHEGEPEIMMARKELLELLERRSERVLEHIFWILGLTYPPGIILPLFKDLRHKDPQIRINTIELLDNILEPTLKKVVISIVETAIMETQSNEVLARLEIPLPTEYTCFESLIKGHDEALKMAALTLIKNLDDPQFAHLLHIAVADENSKVKTYAEKLLEKE